MFSLQRLYLILILAWPEAGLLADGTPKCPPFVAAKLPCISSCIDLHGGFSSPTAYCSWGCQEYDRVLQPRYKDICNKRESVLQIPEIENLLDAAVQACRSETVGTPRDLSYLHEGCAIAREIQLNNIAYPVEGAATR